MQEFIEIFHTYWKFSAKKPDNPFVFDLQRFDSSALAVLLSLRRSCQRHGKTLAMRGLAPRLRTLAGLYGVSGLLADEAPNAPDSA